MKKKHIKFIKIKLILILILKQFEYRENENKEKVKFYFQRLQIDNVKRIINNKFIVCKSENYKLYHEIDKMRFFIQIV